MSRTRRMSRWLIAATAIVLVLGVSFWFTKRPHAKHKVASAPATQPAHRAAPVGNVAIKTAPAPAAPATQPAPAATPQPLVMTTPGFGGTPTTQPALLAAVAPVSTATAAPVPAPARVEKNVQLALNTQSPTASAAAFTPTTQPALALSTQPLVDAKSQMDAGRLLDARRILNASLDSGKLSATDIAAAKQMLNTINATVVFSSRRFPDDEYGGTYTVKPGDRLQKLAAEHDVTWELLCRINGLSDPRKLRSGQSIKMINGPFHAMVLKKSFTLEIYLGATPGEKGSIYVTSFPVGLGKDDSTPTGVWMCEPHNKIKHPTYYSPRGEGVIAADDPANPLGGFWIGLTGIDGHAVGKTSYGIHGTIHPESIGKMESMGCIRLKKEDIAQVFELLVDGKSTVIVKD